MSDKPRKVFVIGHKNPDTDSICSAIAYANLKNKVTGTENYVPMRGGRINAETKFVLDKFGMEAPAFVEDVGTQIRDIDYREWPGVDGSISLKKAYTLMNERSAVTLAITENDMLKGIITIGDIAKSYMDVYDSRILSESKTSYKIL